LSAAKWWLSGGAAVGALIAAIVEGRWAIVLAVSAASLGVISWVLEKVLDRRRIAGTWPARFFRSRRAALVRTLKASGHGILTVSYVPAKMDARIFAEYLHDLLEEAGWQTSVGALYWTPNAELIGLELRTTAMFPDSPALAVLRKEMRALGFRVTTITEAGSPMETAKLIVGERPSQNFLFSPDLF
jgi:hypothetical protein